MSQPLLYNLLNLVILERVCTKSPMSIIFYNWIKDDEIAIRKRPTHKNSADFIKT